MNTEPKDHTLIEYHLRRSFTPGDKNYEAQLLYARQLYILGDLPGSRNIFKKNGDRFKYNKKVF